MNVKHLRAKYQIEQYPVVFTFPEQVLYEPRVRVEVVSGVDPAPETFAGLPIVDGNLVAVLVAGGVPGVIYRIICAADLADGIVELEGLLAVKDTAASIPAGSSALPLTLTVTTSPYPYMYDEDIITSSGALIGDVFVFPIDDMDVDSFALSGVLRELIAHYTMRPEDMVISSLAGNGVLRELLVQYVMQPEELDIVSLARNGTLRYVILAYLNYIPEPIDVTSVAMNGTLA